jgi:N-acetyl-alpha-D-muramate 1-phosphate uridylyltransferase
MTCDPRWRPHAAFVLAAGLGTRMRHLSETLPKPMVPLNGVPLIDRVLDRIADAGIGRAVVNVHYLADVLEAHLSARLRPDITISDERGLLLDTGGGVIQAWPQLCAGPFLIHNSDSVWIERAGVAIDRLCGAFDPDTMDSLMLLAPTATSLGYDGHGDFDLEADGRLSRRGTRAEVPYVFAGVSIAHPRLFAGHSEGRFSLNKVWDRAIGNGRLHGHVLDGIWMHVGTPEAVTDAERLMTREEVTGKVFGHGS